MGKENYYVHNLETGKLNVFTTKPFYDQLKPEHKSVFKQFCLWSRNQACWISKGKADNVHYLKTQLQNMGFTDQGKTGEKISFEEQVSREEERASARAGRYEERAEAAERRSDELFEKAKEMASVIPFGQPILVGHHSERRDRNYREKIHNKFGKAFEEQEKANHYTEKAIIAKNTAEAARHSNPLYLNRRIKECEKTIRILERRLKGKLYANSPEREISTVSRNHFNTRLQEEQDKLSFYSKKLKEVVPEPKEETSQEKGIKIRQPKRSI